MEAAWGTVLVRCLAPSALCSARLQQSFGGLLSGAWKVQLAIHFAR